MQPFAISKPETSTSIKQTGVQHPQNCIYKHFKTNIMNGIFDNIDFYPTPENVIFQMLAHLDVNGKTILEPSAGKGDILNILNAEGANVIYCETSTPLQRILHGKGRFLCPNFLDVTSDQISHINGIVMNPPFSDGVKHILHAFSIAPAGCTIVALINHDNIKNDYTSERKQLKSIIKDFGSVTNLGDCFSDSERKTNVNVGLIYIKKTGSQESEFDGFFMDDEEEKDGEAAGLMSYNVVRDIVNRYVKACKIYDAQLNTAIELNNTIGSFFSKTIGFTCTTENQQTNKQEFKKDLQREGWSYIFKVLDLQSDMTRGVREKINKFVEQQYNVPFTMRNIYKMLEIIVATRGQTMDKAIEEAFDRITEKHHDNRHHVKGWKTNLHYLVGKKFILPYIINPSKEYGYTSETYNSLKNSYDGIIPDLEKALCFVTGEKYSKNQFDETDSKWVKTGIKTVNDSINRNTYGEWYESHYFKYKGYKNGNMHFEWKDDKTWNLFNQRVAKIKGYPLFEQKEQTGYQQRNAGQQNKTNEKQQQTKSASKVLFEFDI